ncbi:MAG TPA: type II toxin-antitoxin system VapC family toxin [Chloroflexota bacterium]|nr:type II toxin-antitoxin system VapC family toxin [Chloroflexota bacterium]
MILVDSDVLIAHLRGRSEALEWMVRARQAGPLSISAVSVAELAGGMRADERTQVRRLLASFRVAPVTTRIAWRASEFMRTYRRSHQGIGLADYLLAGTADTLGFELATLNVRHYPMLPRLKQPFPL